MDTEDAHYECRRGCDSHESTHPPPASILNQISIDEWPQKYTTADRSMENHHTMTALMKIEQVCHDGWDSSVRGGRHEATNDSTRQQTSVAVREVSPNIRHHKQEKGGEVDGSFACNSHHWHPEEIPQPHGEELDRGQIPCPYGGCVEFFCDGDDCYGEVAAVDQAKEGEEAYCQIRRVLLEV